MSPSFFSWWAALISNTERIGISIPYSDIYASRHGEVASLRMNEDPRYIYIQTTEALTLNALERVYFKRLLWGEKLSCDDKIEYRYSIGIRLLKRATKFMPYLLKK